MSARQFIDSSAVAAAIARLDEVLALRIRQAALEPPLRQAHRRLLRLFLETGRPPDPQSRWTGGVDEATAIRELAASGLIIVDRRGAITGAYPFTVESREHRVQTRYGEVHAMCSIDAMAIGAMFDVAATVRSSCRISGVGVVLEQQGERVRVEAPPTPVYAAIDWNARAEGASCAATLCTEMMFIAGDDNRDRWRGVDPMNRQSLTIDEAAAFAAAVFRPLIR